MPFNSCLHRFGLLLLSALAVGSIASAHAQTARCADYVPQPKPQNASRDIIGQDMDEIIERGYIHIAVYDDFAPFSWDSPEGPKGIDVDIGRLIAKALGVKARFNIVGAADDLDSDLRNYIWQGSIIGGAVSNVMMRVPYNPEYACRIEQVVFTGQYSVESIGIAYRKASYPDTPPTPGYFRLRTVAVENDSIADFYLSSLLRGQLIPNMSRYKNIPLAMQALSEGAVSAAMGPLSQLEYSLDKSMGIHAPPLPGLTLGTWEVGVAVHSRYRALAYAIDDAIVAALNNGDIAAIYKKYNISRFAPPKR